VLAVDAPIPSGCHALHHLDADSPMQLDYYLVWELCWHAEEKYWCASLTHELGFSVVS